MADAIRIELTGPGELRDGLNDKRQLGGEVKRACLLRQGSSPSMAGTILLYGLVKLLLPGSRQLPRTFVLALTGHRVAAFRARGMVRDKETYVATVNVPEEASWRRADVTAEPAPPGITANAYLTLPGDDGPERVRVSAPNSKLEAEMAEVVGALAPRG